MGRLTTPATQSEEKPRMSQITLMVPLHPCNPRHPRLLLRRVFQVGGMAWRVTLNLRPARLVGAVYDRAFLAEFREKRAVIDCPYKLRPSIHAEFIASAAERVLVPAEAAGGFCPVPGCVGQNPLEEHLLKGIKFTFI